MVCARLAYLHTESGVKLKTIVLSCVVAVALSSVSHAQSDANTTNGDHELIQQLLQRVQELEKRLQESNGQQCAAPVQNASQLSKSNFSTPQTTVNPSIDPGQSSMAAMETSPKDPRLQIRGYADVGFVATDNAPAPEDHTSFAIGQFNLFMTSQISPQMGVLGELVVEPGDDNAMSVDLERLILNYSFSDSLNVSVGRYHTSIGYYNTAYHHSSWMQRAVGRPFLFEFEDDGGILPIHNVGVSVNGKVPSGSLGLHYIAEMGNGRTSRSRLDEPVQNVIDENNRKALNLGFFVQPDKWSGLQAGLSYYIDRLTPDAGSLFQNPDNPFPTDVAVRPRIDERIVAAHVVYQVSNFEFLNEGVLVRHDLNGYRTFNTPAFYSQVSRRWGSAWPYFRYQYMNANSYEPVFGDVGLRHGPSVGVRFDVTESAAFKLQYDRTMLREGDAVNGIASQLSFRF